MKFHHVGCAVSDIEKAKIKMATMLNATPTETVYDPNQDASLCMLHLADGSQVELVAGNVVTPFIKKSVTYYHICYAVDDIDVAIDGFKKTGGMVVSPPQEAILFDYKRVAFLITPIGLIELLEDPEF